MIGPFDAARFRRLGVAALLAALVLGAHLPTARAAAPTHPVTTQLIDLSRAGSADLESLPGIGPAKAEAILEHRRTHPFHRIEDLMKVKGIGRKTFARLRPFLTVGGVRAAASDGAEISNRARPPNPMGPRTRR